jgi:hypothetical protein
MSLLCPTNGENVRGIVAFALIHGQKLRHIHDMWMDMAFKCVGHVKTAIVAAASENTDKIEIMSIFRICAAIPKWRIYTPTNVGNVSHVVNN